MQSSITPVQVLHLKIQLEQFGSPLSFKPRGHPQVGGVILFPAQKIQLLLEFLQVRH